MNSQIGRLPVLSLPILFRKLFMTNSTSDIHETLIVLFQTLCKCINPEIIHTKEKNSINSSNTLPLSNTLHLLYYRSHILWMVNLHAQQ